MVFRLVSFANSWTPGANSKESIKIHVLRVPGLCSLYSFALLCDLKFFSLLRLWLLSVCFTIDFKFFLSGAPDSPFFNSTKMSIILDCELSLIFARIKSGGLLIYEEGLCPC